VSRSMRRCGGPRRVRRLDRRRGGGHIEGGQWGHIRHCTERGGGGREGGGGRGARGGEGERRGREDMIGLERHMLHYTTPRHTNEDECERTRRKEACLSSPFLFILFQSLLFFSLFSSVLFLLCTVSLYHAHAERGEITEDEGTPPNAP
jgi:hypothetical protein